jgi:hypothetical protein
MAQSQKDSYHAHMATKQSTAYPLRMPDDLREKVEASAAESGRSVNQEIVARLSDSFEVGKSLPETVIKTIEKACELNGLRFEDALLRYIVAGMQAEPARRSLDEALKAERYRGIAAHQMVARSASYLRAMIDALTGVSQPNEESRERLLMEVKALLGDISRLDWDRR